MPTAASILCFTYSFTIGGRGAFVPSWVETLAGGLRPPSVVALELRPSLQEGGPSCATAPGLFPILEHR